MQRLSLTVFFFEQIAQASTCQTRSSWGLKMEFWLKRSNDEPTDHSDRSVQV
jgi:hypothetical protein